MRYANERDQEQGERGMRGDEETVEVDRTESRIVVLPLHHLA